MDSLKPEFFTQDPVHCARELIGCRLRWGDCVGRIVETEAYHSTGDEASHIWTRPSARRFLQAHQAGDAYVYLTYGMHWLFNILIKGPEGGGFVLIRALEPEEGLAAMRQRRGPLREAQLMSGPAKLAQALGISGQDHGSRFLENGTGALEKGKAPSAIVAGPRIGISQAVELEWRFGDPGSKCLSKKFPMKATVVMAR